MSNHTYLETLHLRFVVAIIDKTAIILLLFAKKILHLQALGLSNPKTKIYWKTTHSIEEIIQANKNYCKEFYLNITELDKTLPFIY